MRFRSLQARFTTGKHQSIEFTKAAFFEAAFCLSPIFSLWTTSRINLPHAAFPAYSLVTIRRCFPFMRVSPFRFQPFFAHAARQMIPGENLIDFPFPEIFRTIHAGLLDAFFDISIQHVAPRIESCTRAIARSIAPASLRSPLARIPSRPLASISCELNSTFFILRRSRSICCFRSSSSGVSICPLKRRMSFRHETRHAHIQPQPSNFLSVLFLQPPCKPEILPPHQQSHSHLRRFRSEARS